MKKNHKLSLIIPVFNEAGCVVPLYREIKSVWAKNKLKGEIIFVNDGSSDQTQTRLERLAKNDSRLIIINLRSRMGKAWALRIGFQQAIGDVIITMDGDLQDDPKEIPRFIAQIDRGSDLVSGWKQRRRDPWSKIIPSRVFNFIVRLVTGIKLHDINCGFKAYRCQLAKNLDLHGELHRFVPVLAAANGYRVDELIVNHRPRTNGQSKYNAWRYFYGLFDLLTVTYLTRFNGRPLHMFGFIGSGLFGLGFVVASYLVFIRLFWQQHIGERPALQFSFLFMIIGVQIIVFGLLAEQIAGLDTNPKIDQLIKSVTSKSKKAKTKKLL